MIHWATDYEQGLKDGQKMNNTEISDTIHRATMVAYEVGLKEGQTQGRKAEREHLLKALDLNATSNDIGRYVYLDDFMDGIRELDEQEARMS
jgi:hypothetical protein